MKAVHRIFSLCIILSICALSTHAQVSKTGKVAKVPATKAAPGKPKPATFTVTPLDGFTINGLFTGIADGGQVILLNGRTGQQEQATTIKGGKFSFKGSMTEPDFKLLSIAGRQPYVMLFIGNDIVSVTGNADLTNVTVQGSKTQNEYMAFEKYIAPYKELFEGHGRFDVAVMDSAALRILAFGRENKSSYVAPLAALRYNQITGDYAGLEELYNMMDPVVKNSQLGKYVGSEVDKNKQQEFGKLLADFTQPDTSGTNVSLSSFRGKYVLIDFWASWCGPCRAENPNLVNSYEKFKDKNFTVLGVSLDRAKEPWMKAIEADHLQWTHVSDLKAWGNAVAQQFGINSIPQNYLLDPQGNVIGKNLRGAALEYKLHKVLGSPKQM